MFTYLLSSPPAALVLLPLPPSLHLPRPSTDTYPSLYRSGRRQLPVFCAATRRYRTRRKGLWEDPDDGMGSESEEEEEEGEDEDENDFDFESDWEGWVEAGRTSPSVRPIVDKSSRENDEEKLEEGVAQCVPVFSISHFKLCRKELEHHSFVLFMEASFSSNNTRQWLQFSVCVVMDFCAVEAEKWLENLWRMDSWR